MSCGPDVGLRIKARDMMGSSVTKVAASDVKSESVFFKLCLTVENWKLVSMEDIVNWGETLLLLNL